MSHGLTAAYLSKKSSISQTRSRTTGTCGSGSTVTRSTPRWVTLVWQARRYLPLMYIAQEPQIDDRQQ